MDQMAARAAGGLADAPPDEILRWAVATFGDRICVTSSMTDAVSVHMASAIRPGIRAPHMKRPCQAFAGRRVVDHLMSVFRGRFCARSTCPLGCRFRRDGRCGPPRDGGGRGGWGRCAGAGWWRAPLPASYTRVGIAGLCSAGRGPALTSGVG